jgi:uncharacterized protein with NRDE domain
MCLLALRWKTVAGAPLVLAANRDESLARPFDGPRLHDGPVPFVAPVDRAAGGSWIGLNAAGLAVAVTNRPQREVVTTRRSRGLLLLDALRAASADRLREALERHLRGQRAVYNNFHLLAASADAAFVVRYHDGWMELTDLAEGDHFLTNEDELDEPRPPAVAAPPAAGAAAEADRLAAALADHTPSLPGDRAPCKHGEGRGTVSASVIALPDAGLSGAVLRFAPGPPCTAPWEDHSALARGLAR